MSSKKPPLENNFLTQNESTQESCNSREESGEETEMTEMVVDNDDSMEEEPAEELSQEMAEEESSGEDEDLAVAFRIA